jgi:hypothetical protein
VCSTCIAAIWIWKRNNDVDNMDLGSETFEQGCPAVLSNVPRRQRRDECDHATAFSVALSLLAAVLNFGFSTGRGSRPPARYVRAKPPVLPAVALRWLIGDPIWAPNIANHSRAPVPARLN